jgi:linoleate 8R-lipoxygenase/9,12-octadecadienoate 8-hydroperoxide 8R-isomerase
MTNRGFTEAGLDLTVDSGHVFYRLVIRAFPRHFRQQSIYAHYPMVVFDENRKIFSDLQIAQYFRFESLGVAPGFIIVNSYPVCRTVLQSRPDYKVT